MRTVRQAAWILLVLCCSASWILLVSDLDDPMSGCETTVPWFQDGIVVESATVTLTPPFVRCRLVDTDFAPPSDRHESDLWAWPAVIALVITSGVVVINARRRFGDWGGLRLGGVTVASWVLVAAATPMGALLWLFFALPISLGLALTWGALIWLRGRRRGVIAAGASPSAASTKRSALQEETTSRAP